MAEPKPSMRAFPAGSFSGQPLGSGAHPLADPGALVPPLRGCNSRCEERESFPGELPGRGCAAGRAGTLPAPGPGLAVAPGGPVLVPLPPPAAPGLSLAAGRVTRASRARPSGGGRKRRPSRAARRERRWARPRPSIRATSPNGPSLPPPPPPLGRIVPRPPCM